MCESSLMIKIELHINTRFIIPFSEVIIKVIRSHADILYMKDTVAVQLDSWLMKMLM